MEDLAEKVENIEKRLNRLVEKFKTYLTSRPENHYLVYASEQPDEVTQLFESLGEISAELGTVKQTLSTRTRSSNGHSQVKTLAGTGLHGSLTKIQHKSMPPSITKSGGEAQPLTDARERSFTIIPPNHAAPRFDCNYEDIGPSLNETKFEAFSSHPFAKERGYFKISVQCLPPLIVEQTSVFHRGKDHHTTFSCQRDSRGFVHLKKGRNRRFTLPCFPLPETPKDSWSQIELKELWENTLRDPPQDMDYIIGDPLFPDVELGAGQGLEQRNGRNLPGIGTPYMYLSLGVTCSIMHGEDVELRSINLLRSGAYKFWLIVQPASADKLIHQMRQQFPAMADCSQALRHLSCLITPSQLDNWDIPYSLDYCKPNEAMVTEPKAFHQVLNMAPNCAMAVNILYGSSPPIPKNYRFCQKTCGQHAITAAELEIEDRQPLAETQVNRVRPPLSKSTATKDRIVRTKTKDASAEGVLNLPVVAGRKRKATTTEIQPRQPKVAPQISILSETVRGKEAFGRFRALVYSWRDRSKPFFKVNQGSDPVVQLVHVISIGEERSHLTEFLNRFAKVKLASVIDKEKAGRTCADPETLNKLMDDLKWDRTKANRTRLHNYLKEGRRWRKLCGSFDGLLCLIPPNRESTQTISGRIYYELDPSELEQFHLLLNSDEFMPLFQLGSTLQTSIWHNTEVPEFKWESEDLLALSKMSFKKLAPLMGEFVVIKENEWNATSYNWPKPDCWLWEWPKPPSWVPLSNTLCNLCEEEDCSCIISCLPHIQPQISNEVGKGQGIRAVGVQYKKGQILGELLGEFVPLDTFSDGWSMEFRRPDLGDEPIAQIYSKEKGNWVRKVNHSCDPSAKFEVMKISQMWRQMIIAVKDISHDEEITAFCGANFLRGQGKACSCSLCSR